MDSQVLPRCESEKEVVESPKTSICAFVNCNSGERSAAKFVVKQLNALLGADNVFDLFPVSGEPPAIATAKQFLAQKVPQLLLVAGGDGTVSLSMDLVDALKKDGQLNAEAAPIAVLPMGTGNDLSRSLGFGGGYTKPLSRAEAKFEAHLHRLFTAQPRMVDRFQLTISNADGKVEYQQLLTNYFSVGFDAEVAANFGKFRTENPQMCRSRSMNKIWYGVFGAKSLCHSSVIPKKRLSVVIDGVPKQVPPSSKAVVVLNMITYAGGNILWQDSRHQYSPPNVSDRLAEVVALGGVWHMVGVGVGARAATKLGQGRVVEIELPGSYTMQYDGEPINVHQAPRQTKIRVEWHSQSLGTELKRHHHTRASDTETLHAQEEESPTNAAHT